MRAPESEAGETRADSVRDRRRSRHRDDGGARARDGRVGGRPDRDRHAVLGSVLVRGRRFNASSERALAGGVDAACQMLQRLRGARASRRSTCRCSSWAMRTPCYSRDVSRGLRGDRKRRPRASTRVIVPGSSARRGSPRSTECSPQGAAIDPVLLAAPTTTPERLAMLVRETRGFLYYVSLTGVTGARERAGGGTSRRT